MNTKNKSNKQPKTVSAKKASSILKVSTDVRAGIIGARPCYTCGILIVGIG